MDRSNLSDRKIGEAWTIIIHNSLEKLSSKYENNLLCSYLEGFFGERMETIPDASLKGNILEIENKNIREKWVSLIGYFVKYRLKIWL